MSEFEQGLLTGLLIGEGSFTGDGKAAELVVKMHIRHERLLRWLHGLFPRTKLYGPYEHGGRHYFMWIARGRALKEDVLPTLHRISEFDDHAAARLDLMVTRYGLDQVSAKSAA
ncbi:MAG TPA: hypothetical protein VIL53_00230 [Solirubrobacterales bacterium]